MTVSAGLLALALMTGCEQQNSAAKKESGADKPAAKSSDSAQVQPTAEDMESVSALIQKNDRGMPPAASDSSGGLPPGHPPLGGDSAAPSGMGAAVPPNHPPVNQPTITPLQYDAPKSWQARPPSSSMRLAEYVLPAVGDAEAGEMVLYYFGPNQGGSVMDNLVRWKGQLHGPDGGPVPPEAVVQKSFDANGMKVTTLEVAGTYAPGAMMPGAAAPSPIQNAILLAAIVETPNGPWFFKGTGPAETMTANRDLFMEMLKTVRQ